MDIDVTEAYFEDIAIHHRLIGHTSAKKRFLRDTITNLLNATRNGLDPVGGFVLIMENPEGKLTDNLGDSPKDYQSFAIWIVKFCKNTDQEAERTIRTEAKKIGLQIISKMKNDTISIPRKTALKWMDLNSINYHPIGPVLDSCYGYRFEITIHDQAKIVYEPADWTY